MSQPVDSFVGLFGFFLSYYAAMQLFEDRSLRKIRSPLADLFLIALEAALCCLAAFLSRQPFSFLPEDYLNHFLISISAGIFLLCISRHTISRKLYILTSAMIARHIGRCVWSLVIGFATFHNEVLASVLRLLVFLASYLMILGLIGFQIRQDDRFDPPLSQSLVLFLVILLYLTGTYLEPVLKKESSLHYSFFVVTELTVCITLLWIQYRSYRNTRDRLVMQYENELQKTRLEQFQQMEYVIEQMNIKSHDLKHQITDLEQGGRISASALDSLQQTVSAYDAFVQTGHPVLDTILTQKKMVCDRNGITLICLLDAQVLNFLSPEEMRDLFGNALDNAIEALRGMEQDKKIIKIRTNTQGYCCKLSFENPCDSVPALLPGGSVVSTKRDQMEHGYGTKSMLRIAQRHRGTGRFSVKDGWFTAEFLFPLQKDISA